MTRWRRRGKRWRLWVGGLLAGLLIALGGWPMLAPVGAQTEFQQGLVAYQSGQFRTAIAHWETALLSPESPEQAAQTWGNLAIAYYETGQYRQALQANRTAIAQFTELNQLAAIGQVQSNLGNVYEALGAYDRAIQAYEDSLLTARETDNRFAEGVSLGNLGYLHFLKGDRNQALTAYQQSLDIAQEIGDREGMAHRRLNLGIAYHADDQLDLARQQYTQAHAIAQELNHLSLQAKALNGLGMVEADQRNYDQAIAHYERSLKIAENTTNPELKARTLNNLGHTLLAAHRLDEAEGRLRNAIAYLESLRTNLDDAFNVSIFDTQIYTYNLLTQILVAKGEPEAALEVAEAGRARAFVQLLQSRFIEGATGSAPGTLLMTTAEMQRLAQEKNATLIEYALVPDDAFRVLGRQRGRTSNIHIWVIQPDGKITFRQRPIAPEAPQLEDLVKKSRQAIGVRSRGVGLVVDETAPTLQSSEALQTNLRELHRLLIDPIADLLPEDPEARVVFVPQETLFMVPFAALQDESGQYFIQQHTILTAPSLQVLALTGQANRPGTRSASQSGRVLVVGNPEMPQVWEPDAETLTQLSTLPGAEAEAMQVAELLNATALTGQAASEAVIKEEIEAASIIHLATHGLLEYGQPEESGVRDVPGAIALAPEANQDGLLTSAEILNELSIRADLVVLSACDTGRGDITGDGVSGLSRAFLGAGATSVVVSLWAVPDAPTAQLMVSFYEALARGDAKATALRYAMMETLKDTPNPRDWAAFTLVGQS